MNHSFIVNIKIYDSKNTARSQNGGENKMKMCVCVRLVLYNDYSKETDLHRTNCWLTVNRLVRCLSVHAYFVYNFLFIIKFCLFFVLLLFRT